MQLGRVPNLILPFRIADEVAHDLNDVAAVDEVFGDLVLLVDINLVDLPGWSIWELVDIGKQLVGACPRRSAFELRNETEPVSVHVRQARCHQKLGGLKVIWVVERVGAVVATGPHNTCYARPSPSVFVATLHPRFPRPTASETSVALLD